VVYMEGIGSARRFMSSLRAAANAKPVVVLKAGRKPAGNAAAQTHSGTIVGSDDVFAAALRRAGAVRVRSFVELFSAAKCLASRYRPVGKRLAVVTNGGGPGVLAADWISELGLELGTLSAATIEALRPQLSPLASLTDLIDLGEDASAECFAKAVEATAKDSQVDGIIYPSRLNGHTNLALFDRAIGKLKAVRTTKLIRAPGLADILNDLNVAIVEPDP